MNMSKVYKRDNYLKRIRGFYHYTDKIKVISGIRRSVKFTSMEMIKDELIDNGVSKENIFINMLNQ